MKPKLLIFINSLRSGGAERVVSQLLSHIQDDFDIHLALYSHIIEYDIPAGIKIFDLKQSENDGQLSMLLKLPFLSYKVNSYCKKNGITHSVAFLNRPCYINALMRSLWGYKGRVVMCERTHQTAMLKTKSTLTRAITKFLIRVSYNRADLVLANAQAIKDDLRENIHVNTPIEVIYNPIDISELQHKMQEPLNIPLSKDVFYFIAVGNFRKEKNFPLLLDAFALLKHMNCKLLLVGDGPLGSHLKKQSIDLGIAGQVIFCGRDNNPFKYIHQCNAFILCSDAEGFPNVLLEALACGKPVISTDCRSGPREMLAPSTDPDVELTDHFSEEAFGILTPVGNAPILANAMKKMITDVELRNRLQDKAAIRANDFDVSIIRKYFVEAFAG
jgi:N-acetylgalactosamine-N,N'-diacetylbacillosaminyl-diphospho-undecaprenol 4-alpha-N-acetylgalactosaminyltransferase